MDGMINQDEINKLLDEQGENESREAKIRNLTNHKPTYKVIKLSDFKAPKIYEKHQFQDIPFIDMSRPVTVSPLTADITDTANPQWVCYPEYKYEEKIYVDDKVWEIKADRDTYYVVIFAMNDPSMGLFGALGSWTPYQTVLFNEKKEPVSEHAETGNADHVRTYQCNSTESMIRHLTVWGMITSTYSEEIQRYNEELQKCYKTLIDTNKRITDIYRRREAVDDSDKVNIYSIDGNTYEEFIKRNQDLC